MLIGLLSVLTLTAVLGGNYSHYKDSVREIIIL